MPTAAEPKLRHPGVVAIVQAPGVKCSLELGGAYRTLGSFHLNRLLEGKPGNRKHLMRCLLIDWQGPSS